MTIDNNPNHKELQENKNRCSCCNTGLRVCRVCEESKPLDNYVNSKLYPKKYRHGSNICIACYADFYNVKESEYLDNVYQRAYRELKKEIIEDYEREKRKKRNSHYRKSLQNSAHNAVAAAIRRGDLDHPSDVNCVICGSTAEQYHHWAGYNKRYRLAVMPLCVSCHRHIHRRAIK